MAKTKKQLELEQQIGELTQDVQRTRADFENYRKRMDSEKTAAYQHGQSAAIIKLLPIIDNIERAIGHMPQELAENTWAQGVASLPRGLAKQLESLNVSRIDAKKGTLFDPQFHEAVQVDEESEGETEVVAAELQAGYMVDGQPIRHAMVQVTRQ